jgi:hypothetical protein
MSTANGHNLDALVGAFRFSREWGMPTGDTFDCPPIGEFVGRWLRGAKVSIDPFARNKRLATWTNDLNPETAAQFHLDALDFLRKMESDGVVADMILFDPPYSPRQVKELYEGIGKKMTQQDGWRTHSWKAERDVIHRLVPVGGVCLSFGWDSMGMGKKRGWAIEEIRLVCHGAGHSDTICMAERKVAGDLFDSPNPGVHPSPDASAGVGGATRCCGSYSEAEKKIVKWG